MIYEPPIRTSLFKTISQVLLIGWGDSATLATQPAPHGKYYFQAPRQNKSHITPSNKKDLTRYKILKKGEKLNGGITHWIQALRFTIHIVELLYKGNTEYHS